MYSCSFYLWQTQANDTFECVRDCVYRRVEHFALIDAIALVSENGHERLLTHSHAYKEVDEWQRQHKKDKKAWARKKFKNSILQNCHINDISHGMQEKYGIGFKKSK